MRLKSLVTAALALTLLAGCSMSNSTSSPNEFGETEKAFAEMMIPHHEQAIEMADLAPDRTQNPEILALADAIKLGQEPEIELMQSWAGDHAGHGDHSGMAGMLSDEEMDRLRASSGAEFEKLFLEAMIKHHEGALGMLSMLSGSKNPIALALRDQIDAAQRAEIEQMKQLLKNY